MTPYFEELIQRSLDAACTAEEEAELSAAIAKDPELAQYQARLRHLDSRLRSLPMQEPPTELRSEVMHLIRRQSAAHSTSPRPALRRDLILFLAGVAATLLLTVGLGRNAPTVREEDAAATAMPSSSSPTQPIRIGDDELGELRWTPSSNGPSLELQWHATTPARLELELDPTAGSTLQVWVGERSTSIPLGARPGSAP